MQWRTKNVRSTIMSIFSDKGVDHESHALHWDIDSIVAQLRALRTATPGRRFGDRPAKLPSQKALEGILDGLAAALFPNRLGLPDLTNQGVDYFVGNTLDLTLRELLEQVRRELEFSMEFESDPAKIRASAVAITHEFASQLPTVRQLLESDIRAAYQGDPAARSVDEVLVCYPGVTAVTHHRLAHVLNGLGAPLLARMIAEVAHSRTGIDIHPGAQIGRSFFIDHGTGVVIGESAIIGERVRLYQAVTLGARRFPTDDSGAILKGNARHPIVEDDVVIYAGATILGRITIGKGSIIGGNVWLTRSVPPGSNITQAKNRTEAFDDGGGI
jgi:serine O-acetyltransferase